MSKLLGLAFETVLDVAQAHHLSKCHLLVSDTLLDPVFPQQACFSCITEHPTCLHAFAVTLFPFASSLLTLTCLLCPVLPLWEAVLKVLFHSPRSPFSLIPLRVSTDIYPINYLRSWDTFHASLTRLYAF